MTRTDGYLAENAIERPNTVTLAGPNVDHAPGELGPRVVRHSTMWIISTEDSRTYP